MSLLSGSTRCHPAALAIPLLCLAWSTAGVSAERPNIITVFIDDMGWSDLSCFGGKGTTTENIDRLAAEGLRFTNFYVNSPICSPSRVALTTGQYPHRWRITSYLAHRRLNTARGMAQWLDPQAPVLARELQRAGYATGHFGKWHMGGQRDVGEAPLISRYGFDCSLTNFEGLGPRVLPLKDAYDGTRPARHDLGSAALGRGPIRWEDRSVVTAAFVQAAIEFIDQAQASNQPFYINLWPDDVHSPFFPPQVLRDGTDGSKKALYHAVLDAMDQQLGLLFDRVRGDEQLLDNTLILVASDNGHEEGAGSSEPLRGGKTWLYEGGVRSPLIGWGPGLLDPKAGGTTNRESIFCALDLNRSLYTLTGTPLPAATVLDGEDLSATLLGKAKASRVEPIFWRRPPDRPGNPDQDNPDLAVRDGKWKFYINYDGSSVQLYNLETDLSETDNVAGEHPEVTRRLIGAVIEWNALLPADAGDPEFAIQEARPAAARPESAPPTKQLILPGEAFLVNGRPAFVLLPPKDKRRQPQPWIMYAPTLPAYPDVHEKWMHQQFLDAGVAVAGIDAGEAYGSPRGQELMSALYAELTQQRGFAQRPCLLGRSRGGLWVSSWAIAHPDRVAGIAGIYPVFDLRTYPGLAKAAPAYGLTEKQLEAELQTHNPIARIEVLAKARIPVFIIHGDVDRVVPLDKNSATLRDRYRETGAGDAVTLTVAEGQGHNFWEGFFRCRELVDFAIRQARAGAAPPR